MDIYLRISWTDARFIEQTPPTASTSATDDDDLYVVNSPEALSQLWLPDLYFPTTKRAEFHNVTVPNFAVWIDRQGVVAYSTRYD